MSRGYFGVGVYHPKFEVNTGTLWRTAHAFGAAFCFTVGERFRKQASDTTHAWASVPFFRFDSLESLKRHVPYSCPLVGVEMVEKAAELPSFVHPARACYLLGAEDHGLPAKVIVECVEVVSIPGGCLNVAVAGSIVLYDRLAKGEGRWKLPLAV